MDGNTKSVPLLYGEPLLSPLKVKRKLPVPCRAHPCVFEIKAPQGATFSYQCFIVGMPRKNLFRKDKPNSLAVGCRRVVIPPATEFLKVFIGDAGQDPPAPFHSVAKKVLVI